MREISESILDILMNSERAGARKTELELFFSEREDIIGFEVRDDGRGMSRETLRHAADPFFSTGGERGAGLGLSLLKSEAEQAGGGMKIESREGCGTRVRAWYRASSLDTPPVGDIGLTAELFLSGRPGMELVFRCRSDTLCRECRTGAGGGEAPDSPQTVCQRVREMAAEIIHGK